MSIRDKYDFNVIENTMKVIVIDTLEKELETVDESVCVCEECVVDMVCFALNRLKPNYSASLYGSLYSRAEAEHSLKDIQDMVKKAISFVSENASH